MRDDVAVGDLMPSCTYCCYLIDFEICTDAYLDWKMKKMWGNCWETVEFVE